MADLADHAYSHTRAVLGSGAAAEEAASVAVRRGGRARWAVLAHGRAEALARADEALGPDLDGSVPDDLGDLAVALAATRPPLERAIVDLDARHDLDRNAFARALGVAFGPAGTRAATVHLDWQRALDPVLLAHLGPGDCERLAAVLGGESERNAEPVLEVVAHEGSEPDVAVTTAEAPSPLPRVGTLRDLLHLGPAVSDHVDDCDRCGDRVRAMVSVRTLLSQRPLEPAPAPVRRAATGPNRLRRPVAPPPLDAPSATAWRWRRPALAGLAAALALLAAAIAIGALRAGDEHDDRASVASLTRVPASGSELTAEPAAVEGTTPPPVELTNDAARAIEWRAEADVPWLVVSPAAGTLPPGESATLQLAVTPAAPEGDVKGAVRITGTDGSNAVVRLNTTVERPPQVAATAQGCHVVVTVEDDGEIDDVRLHWREPLERTLPLVADSAGGYAGDLPRGGLEWWVTATDARGNEARTPDANLPPDACP